MNPDQLSSKLFYEGSCGSLAAGSDTRQNTSPDPGSSGLNVMRSGTFRMMASFLLAGMISQGVYANPELDAIVSGGITTATNGSTLTINQSTDKAIIHWQDFSIGAGETTNFAMPSASSAVLNRVTGGNLSNIMGTLNANGQVYLINPNGIVVGSDGVINTQSFIASTLDVSDADFNAGGDITFSGDSTATIINMGRMDAHGGDVFLIAHQVENEGLITARDGAVGMAAGQEVLLTRTGDQRLAVKLGGVGSLVINKGEIQAIEAELKAVSNNPFALAVNNAGLIQASGTETRDGRIYLSAGNGTTSVSGTLVAGTENGRGGEIQILGDHIQLTETASIDASGTEAGNVLVGGDFQGKGDLKTAQTTTVEQGAVISADSSVGDGGTVILWSDDTTGFAGDVSARGAEGHNGGFVEVSGKESLLYRGQVNTGGGTLLLDPRNIEISGSGGSDINGGTITAGTLMTELANNNVVLETSGDGGEGNITVDEDVLYSSENNLTLLAHNNVVFNASVQNRHDTGGDLNVVAGWDGSTGFDAATYTPNDLNDLKNTTIFGQNEGSVYFGSAGNSQHISVGSRNGANRIYGHDIRMETRSGHILLGFSATNQGDDYHVTGSIDVVANGLVELLSGGQGGSDSDGGKTAGFVQIGHIGADRFDYNSVEANVDANINITSIDGITLRAGQTGRFSNARIGHGGERSNVDIAGDISLSTSGDITLTDGALSYSWYSFSQVGHYSSAGDTSGDITIHEANDVFISNTGLVDLSGESLIGHSGRGSITGDITLNNINNFTIQAKDDEWYKDVLRLGHNGNASGNIAIYAKGYVTLQDADSTEDSKSNVARIGHSSPDSSQDSTITIIAKGLNTADSNTSVLDGHIGDIFDEGLDGGDIMIGLTGTDIQVDEDINYHAEHDLTLMSTGDILFNASLQNHHDSSGDINLVAGWDGAEGITEAGTFDFQQFVDAVTDTPNEDDETFETTTLFGQNEGSIRIGDGSQDEDVSVGARSGQTRVYTHGLDLQGGSYGHAQLGYRVDIDDVNDTNQAYQVGGDIEIAAKSDVNVSSGSDYAQIGHVGNISDEFFYYDNLRVEEADITLRFGGDLTLTSEDDGRYAQLGHGGTDSKGIFSGDIWLAGTGSNAVNIISGDDSSYAQIGHGGDYSSADISGDITLTQIGELSLAAGDSDYEYAAIGHGAGVIWNDNSSGQREGDITIEASGDITTVGKYSENWIGHSTDDSEITNSNLNITANGWNVIDLDEDSETTNTSVFDKGIGEMLGSAQSGGDVTVALTGTNLLVEDGESYGIDYEATNNVTLMSAGDIDFNLSWQNHDATGGDMTLVAGWDGTSPFDADNTSIYGQNEGSVYVGNGSQDKGISVGSRSGTTSVYAYGLSLKGGDGSDDYAHLGYALTGYGDIETASGDILISVLDSVEVLAGSADKGFAQIGHSTVFGEDDTGISGNITIQGQGDLKLTAGNDTNNAYAQIGHGSIYSEGSFAGDITVSGFGSVSLSGGDSEADDTGSYAQLGHGGGASEASMSGNILLDQIGDLSLKGGDMGAGYALIGHGSGSADSPFSAGNRSGNITINTSGHITTSNGVGVDENLNHAWIGHSTAEGSVSDANTTITANSWNLTDSNSLIDDDIGSMLQSGLAGGDVQIDITDSGLDLDTELDYESDNLLLMRSRTGAVVIKEGASISNAGDGNIILAGEDFHNDSGSTTPISTGESGRWLVYSTSPEANRNDDEMAVASSGFQYFEQSFSLEDLTPEVLPEGNGLVYVDARQEELAQPEEETPEVDETLIRVGDEVIGNGAIGGGEGVVEVALELSAGTVEFEMENTEAPQEQVNNNESAGSDSSDDSDSTQGSQQAADCRAEPDRTECQQGQ